MLNSAVLFLLVAGLAVVSGWCVFLSLHVMKTKRFFSLMTTGISKRDLKTLLESIDEKANYQHSAIKKLEEKFEKHREKQKKNLQKMSLVRYNPFGDTGGNQSFVLCLLDAEGTGFVVTSLHSREHTRVYAKEVRSGSGREIQYSKEEQEAISLALKKG